MGYLNSNAIEVDAILTKKGRELLAKGREFFNPSQFALSDDEIDYSLWNPNHPLGSQYYGEIIDNMPILEAVPNENQMMKYKLVTYAKNLIKIPQIQVGQATSITLDPGEEFVVNPSTPNFENGNSQLGYTCTVANKQIAMVGVAQGGGLNVSGIRGVAQSSAMSIEAVSHTVMGHSFVITGQSLTADARTTVTITGNTTGGHITIDVLVRASNVLSSRGAFA